MKEIILSKINKIKTEENDFKSSWWNNIFLSHNTNITEHISNIDFNILNDDDLVRVFEYIILTRDNISRNRVCLTYFSNK